MVCAFILYRYMDTCGFKGGEFSPLTNQGHVNYVPLIPTTRFQHQKKPKEISLTYFKYFTHIGTFQSKKVFKCVDHELPHVVMLYIGDNNNCQSSSQYIVIISEIFIPILGFKISFE